MRLCACVAALAASAIVAAGPTAFAAENSKTENLKVVVFDIEPVDMPHSNDVVAKLKAQTDLLRTLFKDKGYTIVDTTPQKDKITASEPLSQCNGCDQDIAKALGADLEVATAIQPASAATFNMSGSVKDVKTNRVLRQGVVDVRGMDPNVWAHGAKFLVRERLTQPPLPTDAAALAAASTSAAASDGGEAH